MIKIGFYFIFFIFTWTNLSFAAFTPHEEKFYQVQYSFIKKNWQKLIKNESVILIDTESLLSKAKSLNFKIQTIKPCKEVSECKDAITSLKIILQEIESECLLILSKLAILEISTIEKNPTKYTEFIKRISDIGHILSKNQIQIIEIFIQQDESNQTKNEPLVSLNDLILISENLYFQLQSIPQILLNEKVQNILILGSNEFIENLSETINQKKIGEFHELDKIFNVINRDLLKNQDYLSASSKSILLEIHQRWNAILKIIKVK